MRTLKFFFSSLVLVIVVGVIGFFTLRELLLYMATVDMKTMIDEMDKIERSGSDFRSECNARGVANLGGIRQIQTAFTSSTEYQLQVICQTNANAPIVIASEKLPMWVTKVPGEAGLIWDADGRSGITLEVFGRKTTIILDGIEVLVTQGATEIEGNKPIAYCKGYGYQCCSAINSIGVGQPLGEVADCRNECYSSCEPRPVVLRLYSDPVPDAATKTVAISRGDQVSFYYTIDPGVSQNLTIEMNYGDGTVESLTEVESMVTHTYDCAMQSCVYSASITARDEHGTSSVTTPVSSLIINVQ